MKIISILLLLFTFMYSASCPVRTFIPVNGIKYLPSMYEEVNRVLPDFNKPYYFGSLIEQESCVRLCGNNYWSRRCWSPISELKNDREQGVGFGQITRAWSKSGKLRFDTLYNLKRKYPRELKGLTWDNIKTKPDLQMKAIMLLWRDNYNSFSSIKNKDDRIMFTDSSYNGGFKYLNRERKECKLRKNCDSKKWFNNVALVKSARAKRKLYGNRTAWDINREHVKTVMTIRLLKYKKHYEKIKYCKDINNTKIYVW